MSTPTVVLVHGAFADASSWSGVIAELRAQGIPVTAPPNPLRGLASDAAYIASVAAQTDGPVVLVGHSYGGAVITVAGTAAENVAGLVYVAAYMLDVDESLGELQGRFPLTPLASHLRPWSYPTASGAATEVTIQADAFPGIFAADVPTATTEILALSQRPLAAAAFEEKAAGAAWRTTPTWAIVATADQAINPDVQRFGAERAGAKSTELAGASHAVAVSRAKEVADVIAEAVRSVG
ncbi:MAG TPA: alpha/beta hydrolase [Streptomyces sp.]